MESSDQLVGLLRFHAAIPWSALKEPGRRSLLSLNDRPARQTVFRKTENRRSLLRYLERLLETNRIRNLHLHFVSSSTAFVSFPVITRPKPPFSRILLLTLIRRDDFHD